MGEGVGENGQDFGANRADKPIIVPTLQKQLKHLHRTKTKLNFYCQPTFVFARPVKVKLQKQKSLIYQP